MNNPIRVEIVGMNKVMDAINQFGDEVMQGVTNALEASALEAITDVRKAIQGPPKTGRLYKRGKKGVHRASAPGEAPATDGGDLVSSIYTERPDAFTRVIGSRLEYAFILEFGSAGGKIAKRPSWLPAAERVAPRLLKRIERVIAQAKAKAGGKTA